MVILALGERGLALQASGYFRMLLESLMVQLGVTEVQIVTEPILDCGSILYRSSCFFFKYPFTFCSETGTVDVWGR